MRRFLVVLAVVGLLLVLVAVLGGSGAGGPSARAGGGRGPLYTGHEGEEMLVVEVLRDAPVAARGVFENATVWRPPVVPLPAELPWFVERLKTIQGLARDGVEVGVNPNMYPVWAQGFEPYAGVLYWNTSLPYGVSIELWAFQPMYLCSHVRGCMFRGSYAWVLVYANVSDWERWEEAVLRRLPWFPENYTVRWQRYVIQILPGAEVTVPETNITVPWDDDLAPGGKLYRVYHVKRHTRRLAGTLVVDIPVIVTAEQVPPRHVVQPRGLGRSLYLYYPAELAAWMLEAHPALMLALRSVGNPSVKDLYEAAARIAALVAYNGHTVRYDEGTMSPDDIQYTPVAVKMAGGYVCGTISGAVANTIAALTYGVGAEIIAPASKIGELFSHAEAAVLLPSTLGFKYNSMHRRLENEAFIPDVDGDGRRDILFMKTNVYLKPLKWFIGKVDEIYMHVPGVIVSAPVDMEASRGNYFAVELNATSLYVDWGAGVTGLLDELPPLLRAPWKETVDGIRGRLLELARGNPPPGQECLPSIIAYVYPNGTLMLDVAALDCPAEIVNVTIVDRVSATPVLERAAPGRTVLGEGKVRVENGTVKGFGSFQVYYRLPVEPWQVRLLNVTLGDGRSISVDTICIGTCLPGRGEENP